MVAPSFDTDGNCPICHRLFKDDSCQHSTGDVAAFLAKRRLQSDLESSTRRLINEELSKRIVTSNLTMFYCTDCGAMYAFDLNQIRKHGLKEVGDRVCHCGAHNLCQMGDPE